MTYFNLRKRDPEPETDAVEADDELADDAAPTSEGPDEPHGILGAVWAGISGPGRWLTFRRRPGLAWLLYAGSAWAVGFYRGWIAAGVAVGWVFIVLFFIPQDALERWTAAIERFFTKRHRPAAAASLEDKREAVRRLLLDLMGDADKVHLNTVLTHLHEKGQWEDRTVTDMRARLTLLGIPHDRNVKVAGVPTWGVRRAALEAPSPLPEGAPSPTPSPPV